MSTVSTVGIDLAKNVFSVHGVDTGGVVLIRRTVSRAKLAQLIAQLPPCLVGMLGSARMGATICGLWSQCEIDGTEICNSVPQEWKERRQ
jgi:hypothetical protein